MFYRTKHIIKLDKLSIQLQFTELTQGTDTNSEQYIYN
jgi:hypothetical protein